MHNQKLIEGFLKDPDISKEEKEFWEGVLRDFYPNSRMLEDV